ncbi:DNA/RNA polymerases superfamily protein [Gossypium australe]|uniref:DNA/RNA polymerases superfamily protein n=1 Tax=Gossypium australe TaxID=47621 RepID=A0A5B6UZ53_9ROSI|nr:DNA/RNA polymerases superfamily protein [Gossypium australe]
MEKEIAEYISSCLTCQKVMAEHQVPSSKLYPLETPEWKLPLNPSRKNSVWVIVDRFTKSTHFLPMNTTYSLEKFIEHYVAKIACLHGIPSSIVSDKDPRFFSRFWNHFQRSLGTRLQFNIAFQPQTDGQFERVIQVLEDMLRSCVIDFGINWESIFIWSSLNIIIIFMLA